MDNKEQDDKETKELREAFKKMSTRGLKRLLGGMELLGDSIEGPERSMVRDELERRAKVDEWAVQAVKETEKYSNWAHFASEEDLKIIRNLVVKEIDSQKSPNRNLYSLHSRVNTELIDRRLKDDWLDGKDLEMY